jgi:hypothetical protein
MPSFLTVAVFDIQVTMCYTIKAMTRNITTGQHKIGACGGAVG